MLVAAALGAQLLFRFADPAITEASGLAVACPSGVVLTHNDSGDTARVFAVDRSGRTLRTYRLAGARNVDWEDAAAAGGRLYLGDIGDNRRSRGAVDVYETALPDGGGAGELSARRTRLRYPDGPHDAETLLADPRTGRLYVVTKVLLGSAGVYAVPPGGGTMRRVASIPVSLATGGDVAADGRVVVRDYGTAYLWPDLTFTGPPRVLDLPSEPQGEAVAFDCDQRRLLVTSEGEHAAVYAVPLPTASTSPSAAPSSSPSPSAAGRRSVAVSWSWWRVVAGAALVVLLLAGALALRRAAR